MLCFSYFCYAQGVPLLMVMITAAVDSQGSLEEVFLPNMGNHECFLGSPDTSYRPSFFATPEFIYYESVLLLINILNLFFFCSAMKTIRAAYLNKKQLRSWKTFKILRS